MPDPVTSDPVTSDIVYDLPSAGSPALSPDGAKVAYVYARAHRGEASPRSSVRLVEIDGTGDRLFTEGPKDSAPQWSPDGATLAFLRPGRSGAARKSPPRQIWLKRLDAAEPARLTDLDHDVVAYAWSPTGEFIIAVVDVDPHRGEGDGAGDAPRTMVIRETYYRGDTLGYVVDAHHHLFRIDPRSGESIQLTEGDYDHAHPAVSPDGKWIAFSSDRTDRRHAGRPYTSQLCLMPAGGGGIRVVTPDAFQAGAPSWNLAGPESWGEPGRVGEYELAAVITDEAQRQHAYVNLVDAATGDRVRLHDDSIYPQTGFFPIAPPPRVRLIGEEATFAADSDGASGIRHVDWRRLGPWRADRHRTVADLAAEEHRREQYADRAEDEIIGDLHLVGGPGERVARAVFTASAPDAPGEIMTQAVGRYSEQERAADRAAAVRLTSHAAAYLASHQIGRTEHFTIERAGLEIPCGLVFPPGFSPDREWPLVLEIHGGPNGFFGRGFNPLHQVIAGAGNIVLFVNPRGSGTYGADFTGAVLGDWAGEDSLDLIAALDEACARPYVDASRVGVHGYSYGGYMTAWLIGHHDRFKAAVAGAPVINLLSMIGTSDIGPPWGPWQWGGGPAERRGWYIERSPLNCAERVNCPVLLMHGDADHRVPISQGEEYFQALKMHGKEVEFVRFPGCSHLMMRAAHPALRKEYYDRLSDWFARWL